MSAASPHDRQCPTIGITGQRHISGCSAGSRPAQCTRVTGRLVYDETHVRRRCDVRLDLRMSITLRDADLGGRDRRDGEGVRRGRLPEFPDVTDFRRPR